jgi:hypothetical protein
LSSSAPMGDQNSKCQACKLHAIFLETHNEPQRLQELEMVKKKSFTVNNQVGNWLPIVEASFVELCDMMILSVELYNLNPLYRLSQIQPMRWPRNISSLIFTNFFTTFERETSRFSPSSSQPPLVFLKEKPKSFTMCELQSTWWTQMVEYNKALKQSAWKQHYSTLLQCQNLNFFNTSQQNSSKWLGRRNLMKTYKF